MNEKQAIEFATEYGIQVTDTIKHKDGRREFKVGKATLTRPAKSREWFQEGAMPRPLGRAIRLAVLRQIQVAK